MCGTLLRIGIIGSGHVGGTLARRLARLGHQVSIANSRGPYSLTPLAANIGATAVSVVDAASDQDVGSTLLMQATWRTRGGSREHQRTVETWTPTLSAARSPKPIGAASPSIVPKRKLASDGMVRPHSLDAG
jgi:glycine/D-amino acid oxidase-like deaminating enzyme